MDRTGKKYFDVLHEKYESILNWIKDLDMDLPPIPTYEMMKGVLQNCDSEPKTYRECDYGIHSISYRIRTLIDVYYTNISRRAYPERYELLYQLVNLYIYIHFTVPMHESYEGDYITDSFNKYYNTAGPIRGTLKEMATKISYFSKTFLPQLIHDVFETVQGLEYYSEIIVPFDHWVFYIIAALDFSRESFASMVTVFYLSSSLEYDKNGTVEEFNDIFDAKLSEYKFSIEKGIEYKRMFINRMVEDYNFEKNEIDMSKDILERIKNNAPSCHPLREFLGISKEELKTCAEINQYEEDIDNTRTYNLSNIFANNTITAYFMKMRAHSDFKSIATSELHLLYEEKEKCVDRIGFDDLELEISEYRMLNDVIGAIYSASYKKKTECEISTAEPLYINVIECLISLGYDITEHRGEPDKRWHYTINWDEGKLRDGDFHVYQSN